MIFKGSHNKEEVINAITHGLGALLAISGLVILVVLSSIKGTPWHIVGFSIFGSALVILYTVSTLYHGFTNTRPKEIFRKFDHIAIFLLIAATYTPFCLTVLNGWIGWSLLGVVWACATGGIILKVFATGRYEGLSIALYVGMGWIVILFIKPVYSATSIVGFVFLMIGGALYSLGVFFFWEG